MIALFGGQGNVDDYLAELEALDDVYRPLVGPLLERAAAVLARAAATPEAVASGTRAPRGLGGLVASRTRPA